jgi:L-ascorbate metabolism protein UlaG (beta-lactamase superfamily)
MEIRWLGWAGVEISAGDDSIVVDLLSNPDGVLEGSGLTGVMPTVVPPTRDGTAAAGLCTHLHRDHADAHALDRALRPTAPVLHPVSFGGDDFENLWLLKAEAELADTGLLRRAAAYWETFEIGPFSIAAVPAVDTLGDPQVSWAIRAHGKTVLHLGDSMYHGYWWRAAHRFGPFDAVLTPINGPVVCFPHCQPPSPFPSTLDAEHAAVAARLLGARVVMPMHYDGFQVDGHYETVPDELERFNTACHGEPFALEIPAPGEAFTI